LSAHPIDAFVSETTSKTGNEDEDVDEFGRRRPAPGPTTPQWPPSFETNGSDYVLDNRSGMFYEARSDFFYDPTTKLYYSQKRQAYFRHRRNKEGKSAFDKVEQTIEASDASKVQETDQKMKVPAISINLKTKALPKKAKKGRRTRRRRRLRAVYPPRCGRNTRPTWQSGPNVRPNANQSQRHFPKHHQRVI
jgi:hypothetical protein